MIKIASYQQYKVSSWATVMMIFGILTLSGYASNTSYQEHPADQVGVVLSEYSEATTSKIFYEDAFRVEGVFQTFSEYEKHHVLCLLRAHDRLSSLRLSVIAQNWNYCSIKNFRVQRKVIPQNSDEPNISSFIG